MSRAMRGGTGLVLSLVGALAALLVATQPGAAQLDRAGLQALCAAEAGCLDAVLAVEAIQGGTALMLTSGSELPGANSTLGLRFGSTPRVAGSVRLGVTSGSIPALAGAGAGPASSTSTWTPSLQGALAVGVFDGFRLAPTVGGLLSVDLIGTYARGFPSTNDGFGSSASAFGYGLRVGLLRESFTLPGATVSIVRRHVSDVSWSGIDGATPGRVELGGPRATSVRATVGKDLLALGITAGLGWDRVEADGSLIAGTAAVASAFESFRTERAMMFAGVTATFLVLQLNGEFGYAAGFDALEPAPAAGAFDPSAGSIFITASARLLF
jgi:hypothetical protein